MKIPTKQSTDFDPDENDNSHTAFDEESDIKSKDHINMYKSSLFQCRQTGSLVDELDDDDKKYDHVVDTDTSTIVDRTALNEYEVRTLDGNVEASIDDPIMNANHDNLQDGILHSVMTSVNVPSTTTTSAMRLPSSSYLLSQSKLLSKITPPQNWDHIRRSGTQIKTLVAEAIGEVKNTVIAMQNNKNKQNKRARDEGNMGDNESPLSNQRSRVVNVADFTVELAREKTAQVMQLQRVCPGIFFKWNVLASLSNNNSVSIFQSPLNHTIATT